MQPRRLFWPMAAVKTCIRVMEREWGGAMERDEECYLRYLKGDDDALKELVERYEERLTLFLHGIVHNMEDAEELMLDTFAQMLARDKKFNGKSTFKTWLFAIGRNQALKRLRKRRLVFLKWEEQPRLTGEAPDLKILREERSQRLFWAMEQLKLEYRQVLLLTYFEDMTCAQTARIMRRSERQISNLLYRGKRALREILLKEGFMDADN